MFVRSFLSFSCSCIAVLLLTLQGLTAMQQLNGNIYLPKTMFNFVKLVCLIVPCVWAKQFSAWNLSFLTLNPNFYSSKEVLALQASIFLRNLKYNTSVLFISAFFWERSWSNSQATYAKLIVGWLIEKIYLKQELIKNDSYVF